MNKAGSPQSPQSDNSSTPTDVFVEHNPLSDEDERAEENQKITLSAQPPGMDPQSNPVSTSPGMDSQKDRQLNSTIPNTASTPRQIRRQSSSRTPGIGPLPKVNCQEKIVICLDLSREMDNPPFRFGDGTKAAPLHVVKRIIELFVRNKHKINPAHEYALVLLCDTATWVKGFSSDPFELVSFLHEVNETQECSKMELHSIFDVIAENVEMPIVSGDPRKVPPPYIVRVVLLYGRSHCIPVFNKFTQAVINMRMSPYFIVDVLYIHETPSDDNKCQEIFDALDKLDDKGLSHIHEVMRNTTKLHNSMAKLLAHPLQRPLQEEADYQIPTISSIALN